MEDRENNIIKDEAGGESSASASETAASSEQEAAAADTAVEAPVESGVPADESASETAEITSEVDESAPEADESASEPAESSEAADVKKKRRFKAAEASDKPARPAALGPTDDVAPGEGEKKRPYRASDALKDEADETENAKKKTYRSDIEDYDEDDEPGDSVFQYKPEDAPKKRGWLIALVCVAAAALIIAALAVFLPSDNPVGAWFDNLFDSTPVSRGDTVMTIDGYAVSSDMYLHMMLSAKAQLEAYVPGYFEANPGMFSNLKTLVEDELRAIAARRKLADEIGASADDADIAEVESYIAETKASYPSDIDYDNALTNSYLTEGLYRELLLDSLLKQKLYVKASELPEYSTVSAEDAEAYVAENDIMCAKHILLLAPEGTDEAARAQKLELANELVARLADGEDFDTLMYEYTEDPGIESSPDGYTFRPGEMVEEFENAVSGCNIGATTGVVESSYGYHIIQRLEPDYAALTSQIIISRVDAKIAEYSESAQVKYSRGFERITLEECVWPYATETISSASGQPTEEPAPAEPETAPEADTASPGPAPAEPAA